MTAPAPSTEQQPTRRTHPVTPLLTGWKTLAVLVAIIGFQNVSALVREFTVLRALIALGLLLAVLVLAIGLSALAWWRFRYEVAADGVRIYSGIITRSTRSAPRDKIESVSVERPLLARLLGLAKVRIEIAGGGDSYLDIAFVSADDAERLRTEILQVARGATPPQRPDAPTDPKEHGQEEESSDLYGTHARSGTDLHAVLTDGVTDGKLLAEIPTERLLRSMIRDLGLITSAIIAVLFGIAGAGWMIWSGGFSFAALVVVVPMVIAGPQLVFSRLESGWGFVSRVTDRGIRMRRGLLNTRTDNLAPGRIQDVTLTRPLLWRGPGWTSAKVTMAGIGDDDDEGASNALPVGTRAELDATLGHLIRPFGAEDDAALREHLLTVPARSIEGIRPVHPLLVIGRRTRVVLVLPGVIILRSGLLARRLHIIPRERIQGVQLLQGPIDRRIGTADLVIGVAGSQCAIAGLPREDALWLRDLAAADARTGRLYSDKDRWPAPPLDLEDPPEPPAADDAPERELTPTGDDAARDGERG
ncbi:MAG: PH domain-containing protein [Brachybacterium sp.]|nr:PH domain-containing protein [Brachybacterium sp.]